MNRLYYLSHTPIHARFSKNSKDFVVTEVPLYPCSGEGEHLYLTIRKKDLTTWGMLQILSEQTGVKMRDFGYAGLKDRDGMTIQQISMPRKFEKMLATFSHEKIKILETAYHSNKLKTGHLKGNRFFIRLKKVSPVDAAKLTQVLQKIAQEGIPNYFGYQRFGREGDNYKRGQAILEGKIKERNKKMRNFFISAWQSHLFNLWLSKRVEISKLFEAFNEKELFNLFNFPRETLKQLKSQPSFFKILPGDLLHHYPHGRMFLCEDIASEAQRFKERKITVTGLLPGHKAPLAAGIAANFEKDFSKMCEPYCQKLNGTRRFGWIWPEEVEFRYREAEAWFEMHFTLPKGSYATVLLEELLHQRPQKVQ
ncbi:MAG: tRNA pseudouridine(13) synthase TruD [Campylobacteraceae bacterium 4484_4]|nr:MAG: tRNA pseudouridine(13) synthase TruD [Campylobacteraceae bacterium 4484_4]